MTKKSAKPAKKSPAKKVAKQAVPRTRKKVAKKVVKKAVKKAQSKAAGKAAKKKAGKPAGKRSSTVARQSVGKTAKKSAKKKTAARPAPGPTPPAGKSLKLLSWNVNGIRAALSKGFLDFVSAERPDVLCIQETKANPDQVELELPGYEQHWNSAEKKGYSGTLVLTKIAPISVRRGMGAGDPEGRVITCEFADFYLVTVYTPNASENLKRLDFRMQWDRDFLGYLKALEKEKPVVFCGDTNVAHKEIDIKNPKANRKNPGFTDEEREGFSRILDAGFLDSFREFNQEPGQYTWWSYRFNARAKNIGWRLDYFCISEALRPRLKKAFILKDVMGSDHCPVGIVLK